MVRFVSVGLVIALAAFSATAGVDQPWLEPIERSGGEFPVGAWIGGIAGVVYGLSQLKADRGGTLYERAMLVLMPAIIGAFIGLVGSLIYVVVSK